MMSLLVESGCGLSDVQINSPTSTTSKLFICVCVTLNFLSLQAYSVYDREVGYCQGSPFITGLLLMQVSPH